MSPNATAPSPEIACPHCGSADVERHARFGSEVSAEAWYCNGCRTVFERVRYDGRRAEAGR